MFNVAQGLILVVFGGEVVQGSVQGLAGVPWGELVIFNPALAAYINDLLMILGFFISAFGFLVAAIAFTGYWAGRPWAWYFMWAAPVFYFLTAVLLLAKGEIYFSDDLSSELFGFLLVVTFLVQTLEARSFRLEAAGLQE